MESVWDILELLDRPRNAIASALMYELFPEQEVREGGFLRGLQRGLSGDVHYSSADPIRAALGLKNTRSAVDRVADLASDVIFDPLNLVGGGVIKGAGAGLGKIGEALGLVDSAPALWRRVSEAIYGSPFGRAFLGGVPKHYEEDILEPLMAARRTVLESEPGQLLKEAEIAREIEREAIEKIAAWTELLPPEFQMLPPEIITRAPWESSKPGLLPDELAEIYSQFRGASSEALDMLNEARRRIGLPEIPRVTENELYTWVPRVETNVARARGGYTRPTHETDESRKIFKWVTPEGLSPLDTPLITKKSDKRIVKKEGKYYFKQGEELIEVEPMQASLAEMLLSKTTGKHEFVTSTVDSYTIDTARKLNAAAFYNWLSEGFERARGKFAWIKKLDPEIEETVPEGWRRLDLAGMQDYVAPKWAANFIEKEARDIIPREGYLGVLDELGDVISRTSAMGYFREATQWWKRNVLAHPAYVMGNAISNVGLMYAGGVPSWLLPIRIAQAAAVQAGTSKIGNVIEGISNQALNEAFRVRGLIGDEVGMLRELESGVEKATKVPFWERVEAAATEKGGLAESLGAPIARAAQTIGNKVRWWNDLILEGARKVEENARVGVAIDYIQKAIAEGDVLSKDLLDRAAIYAQDALVDYSRQGSFARHLSTILPFYRWLRGSTARFAETAVENPGKLANMYRFQEYVLDKPTDVETAFMDPWMRSEDPITGILGKQFESEAVPRILLTGRLNPFSTPGKLLTAPVTTIAKSVNPILSFPIATLFGANPQDPSRPMDPLTEGGTSAILAPFLGGHYSLSSQNTFGFPVPQAWQPYISAMPGARTARSIAEVARGAGLWTDPMRDDTTFLEAVSSSVLGNRLYAYDLFRQWNKQRSLIDRKQAAARAAYRQAMYHGDIDRVEYYMRILHDLQIQSANNQMHLEGLL